MNNFDEKQEYLNLQSLGLSPSQILANLELNKKKRESLAKQQEQEEIDKQNIIQQYASRPEITDLNPESYNMYKGILGSPENIKKALDTRIIKKQQEEQEAQKQLNIKKELETKLGIKPESAPLTPSADLSTFLAGLKNTNPVQSEKLYSSEANVPDLSQGLITKIPESSPVTPAPVPSRIPANIPDLTQGASEVLSEGSKPGEQLSALLARLKEADTSPEQIAAAQEQRRKDSALGMILSGIQQAGRAYGGGANTVIAPPKEDMGQQVAQMGEKSYQDVLEKVKADKEGLATDIAKFKTISEVEALDPNSELSKKYQLLAKSKFDKYYKGMDWSKMPASEIKEVMKTLASLGKEADPLMQAALLAKTLGQAEMSTAKAQQAIHGIGYKDEQARERYQNTLEKHPLWKAAKDVQNAQTNLSLVLDDAYKKGGESVSALGALMADLFERGGRKTDEDVIRYVNPPDWLGQFNRAAKAGTIGKITTSQYTNIKRLVDKMGDAANYKVNKAEDETIKDYQKSRIGRDAGLSYEEVAEKLAMNGLPQKKQIEKIETFDTNKYDVVESFGGQQYGLLKGKNRNNKDNWELIK